MPRNRRREKGDECAISFSSGGRDLVIEGPFAKEEETIDLFRPKS
jgi:hypothetical protein